ncbi:hypothetical protein IB232_21450 [Pseudomonas sp. PDM15]|uniref:hypothetical protein n=1 Tax=Pseudomonas sp. PDM15 TaxID=2769303 RepID=UPI001786CA64|nr:hypothetical protein [Pseudomonas sp. PDM15]MBD9427906.1 hypothetical protein [Pseudomonas sp. PDM15]
MRKPSSYSPRNVPNLYQDRIVRGNAAPGSNVVPLVGRIEDRFFPGIEKSRPGEPLELRWSTEPYSSESLAERDAQTMAILAAEEACIQVEVVSPSVTSLDEQHRGNYAVGSRIEKGIRVYYSTLQCTDWGNSSSGVWGGPYESLEQAEQNVGHSLENWIGAMDLFADSMIPPGEEEIDLDHQPLPSGL